MKKNDTIHRSALITAINQKCTQYSQEKQREFHLRLIRFNGKIGIVKCSYLLKDKAIEALQSITSISPYEVQIKTIATSGTIRALLKNKKLNSFTQQ